MLFVTGLVQLKIHSEYLTKEALSSLSHSEILVLLAKEETVLQSMTNRLTEQNSHKPSTEYDRSKTAGECEIFPMLG